MADAQRRFLERSSWLCTALALLVVGMGAYTRLVDAGLGCPDWPACYGHWVVPESLAGAGFDPFKAWVEMTHRYLAGGLGVLVLSLAAVAFRWRRQSGCPWKHLLALLVLVVLQGLFGMWTVTLKLWPQVVTIHLLGGMVTLGGLFLLSLRLAGGGSQRGWCVGVAPFAGTCLGVLLLAAQIGLGGWTSSNYAALACPNFPGCQQRWWPEMDWQAGFDLQQPPGVSHLGGRQMPEARMSIQMGHRLGAAVVFVYWFCLVLGLYRSGIQRRWCLAVIGLLLAQIVLGSANVIWQVPLPLALAHNLGAALLFLGALGLAYRLTPVQGEVPDEGGDR